MAMKNPPYPGRSIKSSCLEPLNLSVTDAAKLLGVTRQTLTRVMHGHCAISPEMAIRFEKMGWGSARAWLAAQTTYDLAQAQKKAGKIKVTPYQPPKETVQAGT